MRASGRAGRTEWRQAVTVLLAGAALGLLVGWTTRQALRTAEGRRAEGLGTQLAADVQRVISGHTAVLFGLRGLYLTEGTITGEDFRRYVADGRMIDRFPGAQAIEVAWRVRPGELAAFEAGARAELGDPGFAVHPAGDPAAERWVVEQVEPARGNEAALGYDLGAEAGRRAALESARDGDVVRMTPAIRLVQELADQRGMLLVLPLYAGPEPGSVEQRRAACVGFVLVVYRVGDLLAPVRDANPALAFEVRDLTAADPGGAVLLAPDGGLPGPAHEIDLDVHGRTWRLRSAAREPGTALSPDGAGAAVGATGLIFAAVVATFVHHLGASRRIALARARVLQAGEDERRTLERDLHDGAQQRLLSTSLLLAQAEARLATDDDARAGSPARALVSDARAELARSITELRELAHGIHPAALSDHGLAIALQSVVTRAPVPVELEVELRARPPAHLEVVVYYLTSEALANVAKHARATRATVRVTSAEGELTVLIDDDGIGGADPATGSGLRGLADRVEALDGRLALTSPPGAGTSLRAVLPCP